MSDYHKPVLLSESISALVSTPDGVYVDATYGGGGHSAEILKRLGPNGRVLAFDRDEDAIANAEKDVRLTLIHNNFRFIHNFVLWEKFKASKEAGEGDTAEGQNNEGIDGGNNGAGRMPGAEGKEQDGRRSGADGRSCGTNEGTTGNSKADYGGSTCGMNKATGKGSGIKEDGGGDSSWIAKDGSGLADKADGADGRSCGTNEGTTGNSKADYGGSTCGMNKATGKGCGIKGTSGTEEAMKDEEGRVDGILADLGVSSHQFDTAVRGFSFRFDAPLDMRMSRESNITAADIVNSYSEEELTRLFRLYGEVTRPGRIAKLIVTARQNKRINSTGDLHEAIAPALSKAFEHKELAKIYQALRIEVNQEMRALSKFLEGAAEALRPGGRLVIITYHSLEDRMVKNFIRTGNIEGVEEKDIFGRVSTPFTAVNRKPIHPTEEEISGNTRARSAKMRIAERIGDGDCGRHGKSGVTCEGGHRRGKGGDGDCGRGKAERIGDGDCGRHGKSGVTCEGGHRRGKGGDGDCGRGKAERIGDGDCGRHGKSGVTCEGGHRRGKGGDGECGRGKAERIGDGDCGRHGKSGVTCEGGHRRGKGGEEKRARAGSGTNSIAQGI